MDRLMLCTVDEALAQVMSNNASYTGSNKTMRSAIVTATSQIVNHLGRKLLSGAHTDVFSLPKLSGTPFKVWTRGIPLVPNTLTLTYADNGVHDDVYGGLAADEWELLDAEKGIVQVMIHTPNSIAGGLRLKYTAGWAIRSETPEGDVTFKVIEVPQDLVSGCAIQAAFVYDRTLSSQNGTKETGSGKPLASLGIAPEAMSLISSYKSPRYR